MVTAYVDGSCLGGQPGAVGYATAIERNGQVIAELSGRVPGENVITYNKKEQGMKDTMNVSGEIHAVVATLKYCMKHNITDITFFYDYEGVEKWATGKWKRNTDLTAEYNAFTKKAGELINIKFCKVNAHKGKNKLVDKLAKEAALNEEADMDIWPELDLDVKYPKRKEPPPFVPDPKNENRMAQKPASPKQLKFLKRLKCKTLPVNMFEASRLIDECLKQKELIEIGGK